MWAYVPSTFCLSAPAAADSSSDSEWRSEALASSATWRGKDMPSKYWHHAWKKGGWTTRLFGRMPRPSTAEDGVASWIASLEGTRASSQEPSSYASEDMSPSKTFELEIWSLPTEPDGSQSQRSCARTVPQSGKSRRKEPRESDAQKSTPSSLGANKREDSDLLVPLIGCRQRNSPERIGWLRLSLQCAQTNDQKNSGGSSGGTWLTVGSKNLLPTEMVVSTSVATDQRQTNLKGEYKKQGLAPTGARSEQQPDSPLQEHVSSSSCSNSDDMPAASVSPESTFPSERERPGPCLRDACLETEEHIRTLLERGDFVEFSPRARPLLSVSLCSLSEHLGSLLPFDAAKAQKIRSSKADSSDKGRHGSCPSLIAIVHPSSTKVLDGSASAQTPLLARTQSITSQSETMSLTWQTELSSTTASRSPVPGESRARRIPATSGPASGGSSRRQNPASSFSRTYPTTLTSASTRSPETYKAWATTLKQDYSRRRKSDCAMSESVSSSPARDREKRPSSGRQNGPLWPTAVANDDNKTPGAHMAMKRRMKGGPRKTPTSLQVVAKMWSDVWNCLWPTPNVPNGGRAMSVEQVLRKGQSESGSHQVHVETLAKVWSQVFEAHLEQSSPSRPRGQGTSGNGSKSLKPSRFLNPLFVEWLMGWPPGWTDSTTSVEQTSYACWEMASSQLLLRALSECYPFDWPPRGDEPPNMFD